MSERISAHPLKTLLVAVAILGVAAATAWILWVCLSGPDTGKYAPVIQQISQGRFDGKKIVLPQPFHDLTANGEVYLTRRDDGSFLALFPTQIPHDVHLTGLMYTSRPLQDQDLSQQSNGTSVIQQVIDVGEWRKLVIDQRLNEHWYFVSHGIH